MSELDRRGTLLRAAWELFTRLGYRATTIESIARAAGMAKGSFYLHFRTKDDALFALVEMAGESWAEAVGTLLATEETDVARLVKGCLSAVIAWREDFRLYRNLVAEASALGTPAVMEALRRLDRRFESELARILEVLEARGIIAACDREALSIAILAAYSALIERRDEEGRPLAEERVSATMEALIGGLVRRLG